MLCNFAGTSLPAASWRQLWDGLLRERMLKGGQMEVVVCQAIVKGVDINARKRREGDASVW